jgi:hypothetical protein
MKHMVALMLVAALTGCTGVGLQVSYDQERGISFTVEKGAGDGEVSQ